MSQELQELLPKDKVHLARDRAFSGAAQTLWHGQLWAVEIPAGLPKLFTPAQHILASVNTDSVPVNPSLS